MTSHSFGKDTFVFHYLLQKTQVPVATLSDDYVLLKEKELFPSAAVDAGAQHIPLLLFQLFPCHLARCSLCHVWAVCYGNTLGFAVREFLFSVVASHPELMFHPVVVTAGVRSSPSVRSSCTIFWMRKALCKWMPVSPHAWHGGLLCWKRTASTSRGGLKTLRAAEFTAGHCFHFWQQHAGNQQRWLRKLHFLKKGKKKKREWGYSLGNLNLLHKT